MKTKDQRESYFQNLFESLNLDSIESSIQETDNATESIENLEYFKVIFRFLR